MDPRPAARYEAAYRFGCRVRVTQPPPRSAAALAAAAFDRVFGRRTNCKLWAYAAARTATGPVEHPQLDVVGGGCGLAELLLATECSWANGATEGVVWEGVGLAAAAVSGHVRAARNGGTSERTCSKPL